MRVVIRKRALNAIVKTAIYVESLNTSGSGDRWAEKLKTKINSLAKSGMKLALCRQVYLAKYNYSCYAYKEWVIAFRSNENEFEVCRFIHGSKLY